jgi:malonyl-CoA O-methyltransferase
MSNFSDISKKYEKDSVVRKSASEILFDFLEIRPKNDVLDIGCGTGYISRLISDKTNGKIVGIDPSDGSIKTSLKQSSVERKGSMRNGWFQTAGR